MMSTRSKSTAALLAFFLGGLGIHRFYLGHTASAFAIIFTFGGFFGLWPLIDFIRILTSSLPDAEGRELR